jgi:hypothetical protein
MIGPRGSYATIRSLICLFKWWQAPARMNLQQNLSRALVKRLTWGASDNWSSCLASTLSSIVSFLCVSRKHKLSRHFPVLFHLLSSRHLNDAFHRETYESAHSAILKTFAVPLGSTTVVEDQVEGTGVVWPTFVEEIVPFYIRCLLDVRDVRPAMLCLFPVGR